MTNPPRQGIVRQNRGEKSRTEITRRALAPLAAGAAVVATASCGPNIPLSPQSRQFPKDFKWGVATSAPQIEGSPDADGRKDSIWDVFAPAQTIIDHSDPSVACDSYRRYRDDVAYRRRPSRRLRFSIAWTRIMPDGAGAVNEAGVDYYKRLCEALHERNIAPFATLFHWDLPQALQDKGGWGSRDTAKRLADYAAVVADRLGDVIPNFIILNEAAVHTIVGHVLGIGAPGKKGGELLGPVTHHQNLGRTFDAGHSRPPSASGGRHHHGTGAHAAGRRLVEPAQRSAGLGLRCGVEQGLSRSAVQGLLSLRLRKLRQVMGQGRRHGDHEAAGDFLGVNYYSPQYIKYDSTNPSSMGLACRRKASSKMPSGAKSIPTASARICARARGLRQPAGDHHGERLLRSAGQRPGLIDDPFRIDYLRRHIAVVKAEMEKGLPVQGYFVWSIVDNWEWAIRLHGEIRHGRHGPQDGPAHAEEIL